MGKEYPLLSRLGGLEGHRELPTGVERRPQMDFGEFLVVKTRTDNNNCV